MRAFGFSDFDIYLSTRPEKSVGTDEDWAASTDALREALENSGIDFREDPGEGVFYGPKIDIKIRDSLGRAWQCSTIQVDFNLPERFNMKYRGSDGKDHVPIMIHRALLGSLERFFACLIEHYAGAFPVWLAPEQVRILSLTEKQVAYSEETAARLRTAGVRVVVDDSNEKLGNKIRKGRGERIPYLLVVGEREAEAGTVSVRRRSGDQEVLPIERFLENIQDEIERKETGLALEEDGLSKA